MNIFSDKMEREVLRQGDIILNTQIMGAINLNGIIYQVNQQNEKIAWSLNQKPIFGPAIVLSHSCEIDTHNGIKLTSILLAPLRDINTATSKDKVQELIESNIVSDESEYSYIKYFYLPNHSLLPYTDGCIVDFSKCYSVKKQSYEGLVNNKVIQLDDEYAKHMAFKLSIYFYRDSCEVTA